MQREGDEMGSYIRKTRDEYHIETNYGYGWEVECVEESRKEAKERMKEYRENTSAAVRVRKRRVKVNPERAKVIQVEVFYVYNWKMRVVRGLSLVEGGTSAGIITGTAAGICFGMPHANCRSEWMKADGFGVLLDRLQEAPEEVEGLDSRDVLDAVEWLRRQYGVGLGTGTLKEGK